MKGNEASREQDGSGDDTVYGLSPDGYRLPGSLRLGRVQLQVADLGRSLSYYSQVLGLRELSRADGNAALGVEGEGTPLIELHERPGALPVPPQGRLGLYHYAILLPDRASLGRFVRHLAAIGARAAASDHLVSEAIYLHDPDGLGIEVYADRPRAQWRHQQRQLVMGTKPLDVEDLVEEGGNAPWAGMPKGTRMGHVHLHVGDLRRATEFYHDGLGFDKVVWDYPGALFLSAGGYHHHLGLNTWASGAAPAGEGEARLLEWEIILPSRGDADEALRSLSGHGFPVHPDAVGGTAVDPWGVQLRLRAAQAVPA